MKQSRRQVTKFLSPRQEAMTTKKHFIKTLSYKYKKKYQIMGKYLLCSSFNDFISIHLPQLLFMRI